MKNLISLFLVSLLTSNYCLATAQCQDVWIDPAQGHEVSEVELLEQAQRHFEVKVTQLREEVSSMRIIIIGGKPRKKNQIQATKVFEDLMSRYPVRLLTYLAPDSEFAAAREKWLAGKPAENAEEQKYFALFKECLTNPALWAQAAIQRGSSAKASRYERTHVVESTRGHAVEHSSWFLSWGGTVFVATPIAVAGLGSCLLAPELSFSVPVMSGMGLVAASGALAGFNHFTRGLFQKTEKKAIESVISHIVDLEEQYHSGFIQGESGERPQALLVIANDRHVVRMIDEGLQNMRKDASDI